MTTPPPMVWLPADHRLLGDHGHQMPFLLLGDKYARAVKVGAQAQPVMFPLADAAQVPELLSLVDGVMLTGSPSNVHPSHFNEPVLNPALPLDLERDALTLTLVRECVAQGVPLLGICRGFQEINIAMGGSLHQSVHNVPTMMDHREPGAPPTPNTRPATRCAWCTAARSSNGPAAHRQGQFPARAGGGRGWRRGCAPWPTHQMGWSKHSRWWAPAALPTPCNGTPNGVAGKTRSTAPSSAPLATPCDSGVNNACWAIRSAPVRRKASEHPTIGHAQPASRGRNARTP